MFISSNMRGDISLLNVYCGAAMIEVCLRSKKSAIRWVFGPQTRKPPSNRQGPDRRLFFCAAFTSYYEESDKGQTTTAKKPTKSMNSHQKKRNTSKVSLLYLFYREISKNNDIFIKRSQTSVFYFSSQRLLVTRHRLSCEKVN